MKTLRRVVLEQDGKPFLKGTPEQQAKRAEILKRTKQVKADRNARAARTGGSGTSRPGYSSVSDSVAPLTAGRVRIFEVTGKRSQGVAHPLQRVVDRVKNMTPDERAKARNHPGGTTSRPAVPPIKPEERAIGIRQKPKNPDAQWG